MWSQCCTDSGHCLHCLICFWRWAKHPFLTAVLSSIFVLLTIDAFWSVFFSHIGPNILTRAPSLSSKIWPWCSRVNEKPLWLRGGNIGKFSRRLSKMWSVKGSWWCYFAISSVAVLYAEAQLWTGPAIFTIVDSQRDESPCYSGETVQVLLFSRQLPMSQVLLS